MSAWSFATSRFEERYGIFALIGLKKPVTARLDDLLRRAPYFEDLALRLHRAYEARSTQALDEFTCEGSLLSREAFLRDVGRLRERVTEALAVASFLEVGADDLTPLTERLVAGLNHPAGLGDLILQLDEALPLDELITEVDRAYAAHGHRWPDPSIRRH